MRFKILSFLCSCVLLCSCMELPTPGSPTELAVNSTASTVTTSKPGPSPNQEATSTLGFLLESLCPTNRKVSLHDLGLSSEMNLVVLPVDTPTLGDVKIAYSILSSDSPEPESIANIAPPQGWTNRNYLISADGKWISFIRWETNNFTNRELLVSSLDGSQQITVMKLPDIFTHSTWLSNNKLAIIGVADSSNSDPLTYLYIPLKIIDPFTLEEKPLSPLPDEDISRDQMFILVDDQNYYNIYSFGQSPFEKFVLYDYANGPSHAVFQWLTKKDDLSLINTRVYYENGTFSVVVKRPHGLDIGINLNLDEIKLHTEYENVMERVILPKELLPANVYTWLPKTNSFLLSETNKDIDDPKPLAIFSYDYDQKIVKDYCLEIPINLDGVFPSPDGHFIAFSFQTSDSLKGGITILDLDTGFISVVEDFHMIGWGLK